MLIFILGIIAGMCFNMLLNRALCELDDKEEAKEISKVINNNRKRQNINVK